MTSIRHPLYIVYKYPNPTYSSFLQIYHHPTQPTQLQLPQRLAPVNLLVLPRTLCPSPIPHHALPLVRLGVLEPQSAAPVADAEFLARADVAQGDVGYGLGGEVARPADVLVVDGVVEHRTEAEGEGLVQHGGGGGGGPVAGQVREE